MGRSTEPHLRDRLSRDGWRRTGHRIVFGLLVATVASAAYPLLTSERMSSGGAQHQPSVQVTGPSASARNRPFIGCPIARGARPVGIRCTPPVAELGPRLSLTSNQQLAAATAATRAIAAVESGQLGCAPSGHGGSPVQGGEECVLSSRPATVDTIRAALGRAGFLDVVVRVALPGDPAPVGSALYAVRLGDGCLVGYSGATVGRWIEGPLLDGRCLGPTGT